MNNFFIKKFFPKLGGWIISTLLLEIITWSYLPNVTISFLNALQKHSYLGSFIVFLISFMFYIIYVSFKYASQFYRIYCENVKSIDKSLWECYLNFVISDRKIISGRIQDLHGARGGDLIWETDGLDLKDCDICTVWKGQHFYRFSVRLRDRMIAISLAYLNWRVNTCLAVETHLKDIICDRDKFQADKKYRHEQLKKTKTYLKKLPVFNYFFKLDNRRIIVINENDWEDLKKNHLNNLLKYLQWHINEKWSAILYIYKDNKENPEKFTLSSIMTFPRQNYDDFSDFIIIKRKWDDNFVVFAQNSNGRARIVKETPKDQDYNRWFNSVWDLCCDNIDNRLTYAFHNINKEFVDNIKHNTK